MDSGEGPQGSGTGFLEDLAVHGILQRRTEPQSIGYGDEVGFDYVRSQT